VGIDGAVLGRHDGQWRYTIGQRRGLGIAGEEPLYVLERRASSNEVVVGPRAALRTSTVAVREVDDRGVGDARELSVQLRYRSEAVRVAALERTASDAVRLTLAEPFEAVAPGQSAVFYDNDTLVGGGIIIGQGTCDSLRPVLGPREPHAMNTGGDSWMAS
jgi:tRNA-uridine 2-sulfurtransferase